MQDLLSYFEIIARGAYIGITLYLTLMLMLLSFDRDLSSWKKCLCVMGAISMAIVCVNQVCGALIECGILPQDSISGRFAKNVNMLSIPTVGFVALMLTRHSILSKAVLCGFSLPSILLYVIYGVSGIEVIGLVNVIYSFSLAAFFVVLSFAYYFRYNKALKECYSNIEEYDLSWLGTLVLLLLLAAAMRVVMVSVDFAGAQIVALCVNIVVWCIMASRISHAGDAKVMGALPSILESGISMNDIPMTRGSVSHPDSSSVTDSMGINIKNVCHEKNLLGDFNLNSLSLSNELGCTKAELSDYFSSHNTTFFGYINNLRVEYAAELLEKTNDSALEIGMKVGFRFDNNFRRMFADKYGCDPSVYRQKMRIA